MESFSDSVLLQVSFTVFVGLPDSLFRRRLMPVMWILFVFMMVRRSSMSIEVSTPLMKKFEDFAF